MFATGGSRRSRPNGRRRVGSSRRPFVPVPSTGSAKADLGGWVASSQTACQGMRMVTTKVSSRTDWWNLGLEAWRGDLVAFEAEGKWKLGGYAGSCDATGLTDTADRYLRTPRRLQRSNSRFLRASGLPRATSFLPCQRRKSSSRWSGRRRRSTDRDTRSRPFSTSWSGITSSTSLWSTRSALKPATDPFARWSAR